MDACFPKLGSSYCIVPRKISALIITNTENSLHNFCIDPKKTDQGNILSTKYCLEFRAHGFNNIDDYQDFFTILFGCTVLRGAMIKGGIASFMKISVQLQSP